MDITRPLSLAKIEYVFFHWGHHVQLTDEIKSCFTFKEEGGIQVVSNRIIFQQCSSSLTVSKTGDDGIPILFPILETPEFYFFDNNQNLVFTNDILKSVFYLLSGVQEISKEARKDKLGRFEYQESVQCAGGFIGKPVVNYYFGIMTKALEEFCKRNNLSFKFKRLFEDFGLLLSHDIDRVDLYTFHQLGYHVKELLGLVQSPASFAKRLSVTINSFAKWSGIFRNDNPYWNFKFLREEERRNGFTSTFFFLDKGVLHADAYHSFTEPRMIELFEYLKSEGCEISMHGSVRSLKDASVMRSNKQNLEQASKTPSIGNRQHRLLWSHPETALIEQSVGLQYDSSLGFAAHEGFRNSYCHPFRLYDFENDKMLNIWEFPLHVMDVTLFSYRGLSTQDAMKSCQTVITEVKKFGGVFSLLWHNSFFDETTFPGVTDFYKDLLSYIAAEKAESLTGTQLLDRLKSY